MKRSIATLIIFAIAGPACFAQFPTAAEIKKLKIKKITATTKDNASSDAATVLTYYDANGNDTAKYTNGVRSSYQKITYDAKQRPLTIAIYSGGDRQTETTTFTYKTDGSSTAVNADVQFGLKNNYVYDSKGRLTQLTIPDGTAIKYVYNGKGLLTKEYSVPRNDGVKFSTVYTYNAKNKLILSKRTGDYASSTRYEYDSKGLMNKMQSTNGEQSSVTTYEYGY
ncbi:MAG TPA: RHS repeat domain-containing protein [Ferruginibacter sp.]|nr:RHS repeat domain-containing protein [Ferruginibacter sp.]